MVAIEYSERFVCDYEFVKWLRATEHKNKIASAMMKIKSTSKFHKATHCLILAPEFEQLLNVDKLNPSYLSSMLHCRQVPFFLTKEEDNYARYLRYAVHLVGKPPFTRVALLTSPEQKAKYLENPHYQNISAGVTIYAGEEAIKAVNLQFSKFESERELRRLHNF